MPLQGGCKTALKSLFMVQSAFSAGMACAGSYHFFILLLDVQDF